MAAAGGWAFKLDCGENEWIAKCCGTWRHVILVAAGLSIKLNMCKKKKTLKEAKHVFTVHSAFIVYLAASVLFF